MAFVDTSTFPYPPHHRPLDRKHTFGFVEGWVATCCGLLSCAGPAFLVARGSALSGLQLILEQQLVNTPCPAWQRACVCVCTRCRCPACPACPGAT